MPGKKPFYELDQLREPIQWVKYFGEETDPYDNLFVQRALYMKMGLLFERHGLQIPDELYDGRLTIKPSGKQRKTVGIAPVNPYFNLVAALAIQHIRGFQVTKSKRGRRSGTSNKETRIQNEAFLAFLVPRIEEGMCAGKSAREVISNLVKKGGNPLSGKRKETMYRKWQRLKKLKSTKNT